MPDNQEYISGMGDKSTFPPELKKWNWGAFFFNWVWGIGNGTYIALLMFVPLVNFVMPFVLGAKGNEMAWRNRTWRDIEHFKMTQRRWAQWGLGLIAVVVPLFFVIIMSVMRGEAFEKSLAAIQTNHEAREFLGQEITSGFFVMGHIQTNGTGGRANFNYSVSGGENEAKAYVYAVKESGEWELIKLVLVSADPDKNIWVVGGED